VISLSILGSLGILWSIFIAPDGSYLGVRLEALRVRAVLAKWRFFHRFFHQNHLTFNRRYLPCECPPIILQHDGFIRHIRGDGPLANYEYYRMPYGDIAKIRITDAAEIRHLALELHDSYRMRIYRWGNDYYARSSIFPTAGVVGRTPADLLARESKFLSDSFISQENIYNTVMHCRKRGIPYPEWLEALNIPHTQWKYTPTLRDPALPFPFNH
jgi:hypothetical protein